MLTRSPKGYVGADHETIGSSLLAVVQILKVPEQVIGTAELERLRAVDPKAWYPVAWLLSLMEQLDRAVGYYGLLSMGRRRFELSHATRVAPSSARQVIHGIDEMYHYANRGKSIGGWQVLKFEPGYAELEKTTPHHCVMEQGILSAGLSAAKCPGIVTQSQCFRQGAESCIFTISSAFTDLRWSGQP
jgi:hypothetical protein